MVTEQQAKLQLVGEMAGAPGAHTRMSGAASKDWTINWLLERCAKEMVNRDTDVELLRHSILLYENTTIPEIRGQHILQVTELQRRLALAEAPLQFEFDCDEEDCSCHEERDPVSLRHKLNNLKQRELFLIDVIGKAHNYVTDPKLRATMRKIAPLPPRRPEDM